MKATFALYRILGNDLPPRHGLRQTLTNVRFILDNELTSRRLSKFWILNRIVDRETEAELTELLCERRQRVLMIPFKLDTYCRLDSDYRHFSEADLERFLAQQYDNEYLAQLTSDHTLHRKNRYVMNVNGARNYAIRHGRSRADWILPWDGNCFLTPRAWRSIDRAVARSPRAKYLIIPMERVVANVTVLAADYEPLALEEPQLGMRWDAVERFDGALRYGRFSKVELLRRLKVPGVWDKWDYQPWERRRWTVSREAKLKRTAGYAVRLASGEPHLDDDPSIPGIRMRSTARRIAIRTLLRTLDERRVADELENAALTYYDERAMRSVFRGREQGNPAAIELVDLIVKSAERAMKTSPMSVLQKSDIAASGDPHDYHSRAPFWWPDPAGNGSLPSVRRDGEFVPEASLFSPESLRFDYSRLQTLFQSVTALAFGWYFTANQRFAAHAMRLVACWFVDSATRMNANLRFAQVRPGHNANDGSPTGIIETRDFYYFLDTLRLLQTSESWSRSVDAGLQAWLTEYLSWLMNSTNGRSEAMSRNNHGTCYELQVSSIAAFVKDTRALCDSVERSKARLLLQLRRDGAQPHELARRTPWHYCTYNLQSWANLATVSERVTGARLWTYPTERTSLFRSALGTLLTRGDEFAADEEELDARRHRTLCLLVGRRVQISTRIPRGEPLPLIPHPNSGVAPFWLLSVGRDRRSVQNAFPLAAAAHDRGAV